MEKCSTLVQKAFQKEGIKAKIREKLLKLHKITCQRNKKMRLVKTFKMK